MAGIENAGRIERLPAWLSTKLGSPGVLHALKKDLRERGLHTVCEEARCPNMGECWSRGTATLMILGDRCSRHCPFCTVKAGRPTAVDPQEPGQVAEMVARLNLRHVVITMVARDDLPDGGASHVATVIGATRGRNPETRIEVLTSDFQGRKESLREVVKARPDIFNHNLETVARLTPRVRHRATYGGSLQVLRQVKEVDPSLPTKSGLMLGVGETESEVWEALRDLRSVGCELLTLGQYLRPSRRNLPVAAYIPPEAFEVWRERAQSLGFRHVAAGPLVRSSYHAEQMVESQDR